MTTGPLRPSLVTLFSALASALAGGALIYVSVLAWLAGEIHTKGGIILASTSPLQFYVATTCGSLFGLLLILSAPLLCVKAFTSAEERARVLHHPKIYKPVRLSLRTGIFWIVLALIATWLTR